MVLFYREGTQELITYHVHGQSASQQCIPESNPFLASSEMENFNHSAKF